MNEIIKGLSKTGINDPQKCDHLPTKKRFINGGPVSLLEYDPVLIKKMKGEWNASKTTKKCFKCKKPLFEKEKLLKMYRKSDKISMPSNLKGLSKTKNNLETFNNILKSTRKTK
jgi:hypothetical protein